MSAITMRQSDNEARKLSEGGGSLFSIHDLRNASHIRGITNTRHPDTFRVDMPRNYPE
ncbi:hypothetical protein GSS87_01835 [Corynebacterium sp. 4HC-13]|uniref:Uncharacterized protein n=1 Tax=Corynebacterium anserum TaxID=2684406 RepID=A0A7G7YMR6_9CORY|nr:hypothetical protein [Corynebacterium anserum]MBC2681162.1 hypothetical protein [Corynebacterium anserum]QNH95786.1 hypothetical protein GP473_03040 [Corynebacterium anserum]